MRGGRGEGGVDCEERASPVSEGSERLYEQRRSQNQQQLTLLGILQDKGAGTTDGSKQLGDAIDLHTLIPSVT